MRNLCNYVRAVPAGPGVRGSGSRSARCGWNSRGRNAAGGGNGTDATAGPLISKQRRGLARATHCEWPCDERGSDLSPHDPMGSNSGPSGRTVKDGHRDDIASIAVGAASTRHAGPRKPGRASDQPSPRCRGASVPRCCRRCHPRGGMRRRGLPRRFESAPCGHCGYEGGCASRCSDDPRPHDDHRRAAHLNPFHDRGTCVLTPEDCFVTHSDHDGAGQAGTVSGAGDRASCGSGHRNR